MLPVFTAIRTEAARLRRDAGASREWATTAKGAHWARPRVILYSMDEHEFDERFRTLMPAEYRPGIDFRRATFARAQGQISTGTMLAEMAVGLVRGIAEWYEEIPLPQRKPATR